ncbi:hypothetical protein O3P69_007734 [Scylla paramamosain]|uniref:DDE Tnp4 domain-containing protein n=1 Tax=Scylla paramamosain TaxID=85552 RepID=A0AAW0V1E6_SCYPA
MPRGLLTWRKLLACLHILPTSLHFPGASTMAGILALVHLQHADRADQARLPRRLVKDHQNPFAAYSEEEFVQRYRLSKECIHTLLGQVEPDLPRAKDGRARTYIKFPEPTDIPDLASNFFNIAGMPGCIGCIDGSYINIISPGGDHAELYRSRKGRFAINAMGICDYNLEIFADSASFTNN